MSACVYGFALMPLMDERFVLQVSGAIDHCGLVVHSNSADEQTVRVCFFRCFRSFQERIPPAGETVVCLDFLVRAAREE